MFTVDVYILSAASKANYAPYNMLQTKVKCGYCYFVLSGFLDNVLTHSCFQGFDSKIHAIYIDDNRMLTMIESKLIIFIVEMKYNCLTAII